jgi:hypothetical protein
MIIENLKTDKILGAFDPLSNPFHPFYPFLSIS